MQVNVHSIQFKADEGLVHFIQSKIQKLEQYNHKLIGAEVYLRLDKNSEMGNKIAEIKLIAPEWTFSLNARQLHLKSPLI